MAKTNYYILVNKKGNPIVTGAKLPIYWNKNIANDGAKLFKAFVKPINIAELLKLIKDK